MEPMSADSPLPQPALALPQQSQPSGLLRRLRTSRGFTLIEIMLVVVVIGILSTFAIPYFQRATARARRGELQVVLEKLHVYFINQYENNNSFATAQFPVGFVSAWNPDTSTPTGQAGNWVVSRSGWQQIPFAFDGGLKMRYQYTVVSDPSGATSGTMTIVVEGDMPGLGPKIAGHTGNYLFTETLTGPYIADPVELPNNF